MKRALALCLLFALGCGLPASQGRVGEKAPDYATTALNGDSLHLTQLRGQVVLLNVWATWCIPCRKEMPELQALHQKFAGQGLQVLGVSTDDGNADGDVRDFVKEFGISYTILRDPGENVSSAFFIPGVPASFLIDRSGTIVWRREGPFSAADPELQRLLQQAL